MKKLLFYVFILFILKANFAQTQERKTMVWDGAEREYLRFLPENLTESAPVLFCLHGWGDNMFDFSENFDFNPIASENGWIVITPQALPATVSIPLLGEEEIGTMWNAGISISFGIMDIHINADVDDKGFLMAILDTLIENYNIDQSKIFFCGFSMGGFMANRMAIEYGDRITAIASASGTIATSLSTQTPVAKVNTIHIHGDADEMVSYANASFSFYPEIGTISLGLGAEATVEYWRNHNQCNTTAEIYEYPDLVEDGLTFTRYTYSGGADNTTTVLIRVNGGVHLPYFQPYNDIDYRIEMFNFFTDQPVSIKENDMSEVSIYPNPVNNTLFIEGNDITRIEIYDMQGRIIKSEVKTTNQLNVSDLNQGIYMIKVQTVDGQKIMKFVKI